MNIAELRAELSAIMAAEEMLQIDWEAVQARCLRVIERLNAGNAPDYEHDAVYHFLDDVDIRRKDTAYAARQRSQLREWLSAVP